MGKKLYANGITGDVSISEENANLSSPLNNLNEIYFHSSLDYMNIVKTINGTIYLPYRQANESDSSSAYGSSIYNITTHGLGYSPLLLGYYTSTKQPICGECFIQASGSANLRTIMLGGDNNYIYMRELFLNKTISFGGVSLSYTIFCFNKSS